MRRPYPTQNHIKQSKSQAREHRYAPDLACAGWDPAAAACDRRCRCVRRVRVIGEPGHAAGIDAVLDSAVRKTAAPCARRALRKAFGSFRSSPRRPISGLLFSVSGGRTAS